jgi:hypothetical protein
MTFPRAHFPVPPTPNYIHNLPVAWIHKTMYGPPTTSTSYYIITIPEGVHHRYTVIFSESP